MPSRRKLEREPIPESRTGRSRPAYLAPERVQDFRPHGRGRTADSDLVSLYAVRATTLSCRGRRTAAVHQTIRCRVDKCYDEIVRFRRSAGEGFNGRPTWPMIISRTPKGWTGPKEVEGITDRGDLPRASGAARERA